MLHSDNKEKYKRLVKRQTRTWREHRRERLCTGYPNDLRRISLLFEDYEFQQRFCTNHLHSLYLLLGEGVVAVTAGDVDSDGP